MYMCDHVHVVVVVVVVVGYVVMVMVMVSGSGSGTVVHTCRTTYCTSKHEFNLIINSVNR